MDKLLTLEGAFGCRTSTCNDSDVRAAAPLFARLEGPHAYARELPRTAEWPSIASIIDRVVLATMSTRLPIDQLLRQADVQTAMLKKSLSLEA